MSHIVKILVPTNSTFQKMHAVKTRKMMISHRLTQVVDERVGDLARKILQQPLL